MLQKTDPFLRSKGKNQKLAVRLRKNQPFFEVTMWQYRVDVAPNLPKRLVPVSMLYRYRYQLGYRQTSIAVPEVPVFVPPVFDVVPNLPSVPGTDIDVVPNLPKCLRYRY